MQQVIQSYRSGDLQVLHVPTPRVRPGHVLIANQRSVISAGTERMARELARTSLIGKARQRPDQVKRVWQKVRSEGLVSTARQVFEKLDEPTGMGYCSAGVVLACGEGVEQFKPGDRVASNGPHAEVVCVPKHLCAQIPDGVEFEQGAFCVLGAIAVQGVRLSKLGLGDVALVIGLGLVGQLTVALLKAAGCRVLGTDLSPQRCQLAKQMGADHVEVGMSAQRAMDLSAGLGADAVLIAASTSSSAPVELAGQAVRQKGRVVAVGAVGMQLSRRDFYFKEAEFVVSCSYGPGRYDPQYEEAGHDYPAGHVRWTEQRNMQAVLQLMQQGSLDPAPLVTHRYPIEHATEAYQQIEQGEALGVMLEYAEHSPTRHEVSVKLPRQRAAHTGPVGVGCLGVGNFARSVLIPLLCNQPEFEPRMICSAGGVSASYTGTKRGFAEATSDENQLLTHPDVQAVFVATRHNLHAQQTAAALRQGKHVFVEKPLALSIDELRDIHTALLTHPSTPVLMVGFNRRFAPATVRLKQFLADCHDPLTVSIRFNAGHVDHNHWTQNETIGGGRIIGEACHGIDLATFLCGSPVVRVFAESIGGQQVPTDDQCFITLRHANGSISNIAYLAGGDKSFPKERIEVIGGNRIGIVDDFRRITTCRNGKTKRTRWARQDKGHAGCVVAFAQAVRQGDVSPISWNELESTTLASLLAVRSLREGMPVELQFADAAETPRYCSDESNAA